MAKKPKKIEARIGQNEYDPYAKGEDRLHDYVHVRQGDEHVRLILEHPSESKLVESHPKYNAEETYPHGWDGPAAHQRTLWDRPRGSADKPTITGLFATPGAKNLVATAIGTAIEHSHKRFGQTPIGSRDLSVHSLPMVERLNERLKSRGLEESPTPWRPSNDSVQDEDNAKNVKERGETAFKDKWYKPVSDKGVTSANQLIRGLYAGRHLNKQQFHQDELPF
jgi:hypothetical protein